MAGSGRLAGHMAAIGSTSPGVIDWLALGGSKDSDGSERKAASS